MKKELTAKEKELIRDEISFLSMQEQIHIRNKQFAESLAIGGMASIMALFLVAITLNFSLEAMFLLFLFFLSEIFISSKRMEKENKMFWEIRGQITQIYLLLGVGQPLPSSNEDKRKGLFF